MNPSQSEPDRDICRLCNWFHTSDRGKPRTEAFNGDQSGEFFPMERVAVPASLSNGCTERHKQHLRGRVGHGDTRLPPSPPLSRYHIFIVRLRMGLNAPSSVAPSHYPAG